MSAPPPERPALEWPGLRAAAATRLLAHARDLLGQRRVQVAAGSVLLVLLALAGTGWDYRAAPPAGADRAVSPPPSPATREAARLLA
jgi:hypothetical protein